MSFRCQTESKVPVVKARGPPDSGENEKGRRPRQSPGIHKVPADLERQEFMAEEFR